MARAPWPRRQLTIRHHARGHGETLECKLSPQRWAHHSGNWYLKAWCHLREPLRGFSLHRIVQLRKPGTRASDVPEHALDASIRG
ncbi:WYL domain-containing protein [Pseudorhodoferax sp. Leaf267]|uniref:WYL domain-containing protein n=1 Tax=Pseudorhodoferax sp. Leaf267 TaxID=1736316 RepID=UPI0006FCD9F8|nr:WYL domain-containing protein [Pseudorhodoferax sp. Leaf267]KQP21726.1 hypothetical protein ASF43_25835 [Pseudorhodoferax sp. Leaf267]